ncbi:MAG TPA: hypothetical protein VFA55_01350 [Candidatus Kapabacteria bacterium]|nr:hypothetical protein [Candidatus Kapabacteria bacterium]
MNTNSFMIKGWAVTLVSALSVLAAKDSNLRFLLVAYMVAPTFWGLDAFYLSQERQYRDLYNDVKKKQESEIDFSMDATPYKKGKNTWLCCLAASTVWTLYVTILVIMLLAGFIFS